MGNKSSTPKTPEGQIPQIPETPQVTPLTPVPSEQAAQTLRVEEKAQQAAKAVSAQAQKIEDKAKDAARTVKDAAQNAKETVTEKAKEGTEAVKKALDTHNVEDKVKEAADKAKETADKAKEAVKDAASSARVSTGSISGDIHHYLKETRRVTKGYYKEAKHEFDVINQEGPVAIANFKKNHIFPIDPTTRAIIFFGVTGLSFLVGIKAFGGLRAIRNSTVLGLTTGFVVYPEAINPFYRIKKQYTEEQEAQEQAQAQDQE